MYNQLREILSSDKSIPKDFKRGTKMEVIIPTLNEEQTIGEVIRNIRSSNLPVALSILVVDGGSTDHTLDICRKENVRFMIQKVRGKGNGMREAVDQSEADIIVFIDGDGTYCPTDLALLLEPLLNDSADMVVGSRIKSKREKGAISIFNSFGNRIFNNTINFAMNSSITDSLSGYRALYREMFKDLILFSDAFEIEIEMTVEALAKGYRVLEIPINYGLRKGSNTKLAPLSDGTKIGRTLLFILMNVNPLKFFGVISLVFFVVALWPITQALYEKIFFGEIVSIPAVILAALLIVTGILSIVIGMLAELLVRSRRRLEFLINKTRE
ncbi:glycosyltransferase [Candidatus Nitrosocosmicus arcticus]|uniref:Glycosyl transferase family 2 n=1 Tax=Candidatus Nitrosocosmicus arcticus TaxID=2035267 RepID=A0A557SRR0_9ARCH|nr:glycosyltransferase [Candidatus Nitrosocosmicus arcticus]TVP39285.1 Glycosyl transferase family 2 [Candidatus Nitrosocosmicus arcticus]